jgi:hypothetical protein
LPASKNLHKGRSFDVDRQHHRVRRRTDIEPDDVVELGGELRSATA